MDENTQYLLSIFRNTKSPALQDLLDLLDQSNNTPKMYVDPSLAGTNRQGYYKPFGNELAMNPYGGSINTSVHELTHALDFAMARDAAKIKNSDQPISPLEQLFQDAYSKFNVPTKLPTHVDNQYAPRNSPQYNYRRDLGEMRAFGQGNMADPPPPDMYAPVPPHVDATMATDFEILKELYGRMYRARKQNGPR